MRGEEGKRGRGGERARMVKEGGKTEEKKVGRKKSAKIGIG